MTFGANAGFALATLRAHGSPCEDFIVLDLLNDFFDRDTCR